jgi:hypothetical protein
MTNSTIALRTADPKIAAIHLLSLLQAELLQALLGAIDTVKPESIFNALTLSEADRWN